MLCNRKDPASTRPKYLDVTKSRYHKGIAAIIKRSTTFNLDKPRDLEDLYGMKELHFMNIIEISMQIGSKSEQVINMISLMKKEISANNLPDGQS